MEITALPTPATESMGKSSMKKLVKARTGTSDAPPNLCAVTLRASFAWSMMPMIFRHLAEAPGDLSDSASFRGQMRSITRSMSHVMKPDTRDANDAAALQPNIIRQSWMRNGPSSSDHSCMCELIAPPSIMKAL